MAAGEVVCGQPSRSRVCEADRLAAHKRNRSNTTTDHNCDTQGIQLTVSNYVQLPFSTYSSFQGITNGLNVNDPGVASAPSSACASHGSFNSVENDCTSDNNSLPSLDSDHESMSDQVVSSPDDGDDRSDCCPSLGQSHVAFPTNFTTRSGQMPVTDIHIALHSLHSPDAPNEIRSYGLRRFLNAEDDPWSAYSFARAQQFAELSNSKDI